MVYNDKELIVATHLKQYTETAKSPRDNNKQLLSFMKPEQPVSTTPCRW